MDEQTCDYPDFIPIPEIFHSFLLEGPFEKCQVCEKNLLDDGTQYLIEKAFKGEEVIFEYALCLNCRQNMADNLSRESLARICNFFNEYVDFETRREKFSKESPDDTLPWLEHCIVSGRRRCECEEYQIYAQCDGPDILLYWMPYMISGEVLEQIQELLSPQSRGGIDDFVRDYLNRMPDFDTILSGPRPIII